MHSCLIRCTARYKHSPADRCPRRSAPRYTYTTGRSSFHRNSRNSTCLVGSRQPRRRV
ncbi:uncharacterized protein B0H18DRAFT_651473 [Fomitopsis serialis]|uniref:uncharacterized protein n=1 Tax=Fomitopsis serialis TaxID=139415 RepID=UPI002007F6CA|nr:uncharacterized protein B0H18DRAFT_651473 [Neoantrodia serialis]KAH9919247.1 hypothetical protein B0H18DRAFT_651473 [Neoantrodia serialis]